MKFQLRKLISPTFFVLVLALALPVAAHAGVSVSISQPSSSNATVTSTTTIKAGASSSSKITGWYVYVNDRPVWSAGATQYISATISLSSGTHKVYARAWDSTGAHGTAYRTLTVSGSDSTPPPPTNTGLPTPPSNAKVFTNIEDRKYEDCTACAADPDDPSPPIAQYWRAHWQTSPSLSGSSTKFWIGGSTPYANSLHWTKFGNQGWAKNFLWEFYVYVKEDSYKAQNIEFDVWQSVGGRKYMWGSQCNYSKGIWQAWNEPYNKWVDLPNVPCTKFPAGKWTRVVWYVQRTSDNKLRYVTLKVGDKTYNINMYQPSKSTNWADSSGVQFQQDLNYNADDHSMWVDKVKLTIW
jgi:hypothetical protein